MDDRIRAITLQTTKLAYQLARPFVFCRSAQHAHDDILHLLSRLDNQPLTQSILKTISRAAFKPQPVTVGGVNLPHPFILAAGFVKGTGFETERDALAAIRRGENIIPGWKTMPNLVGLVEFGSFTPHPRTGNVGTVIWRDTRTKSTQNRIGLRNPGAVAAAAFLSLRKTQLPPIFGINIAPSPGTTDPIQEKTEVLETISAFLARGVYPSWLTLNLSCPNTEDDPGSRQTESRTRDLCSAIITHLQQRAAETRREIPLWVKISPELASSQYAVLMRVFEETGVRAVIATNTLPRPVPDQTNTQSPLSTGGKGAGGEGANIAGVGGGTLHPYALSAARILSDEKRQHGYNIDIIGCGGIIDPATYNAFAQLDIIAVQYWSALIYRGPLAAALILNDLQDDPCRTISSKSPGHS